MGTEKNEDKMTENLAGKVATIPGAPPGIGRAAAADPSLGAFLSRFEEATSRFINGDPTLLKQNASRRDDATIVGAWGAYERGWNEVGPRYDWAAARFKESGAEVEVEYLSSGVWQVAYRSMCPRARRPYRSIRRPARQTSSMLTSSTAGRRRRVLLQRGEQ